MIRECINICILYLREGKLQMSKFHNKFAATFAAVGLLTAGTVLAASDATAKTVWQYSIWGGQRAVTAGIEKMKEILEAAGGGDFELNINYGSVLGPLKQNPENVKAGAFEAGAMCSGYYPNKFPLISVMELPFLPPRDIHQRAEVEQAVLNHPLVVKELKDRWNMRYLAPSFLPSYEFMGNKRIETTDDMKGVKMRISGLNAKVLANFGATPVMVPAPEGYNALDRGTIDSFGFPYSYAFGAYKLYEVSKYVTEGIGMGGFMCFNAVNLDAWNSAPKAVRDAWPKANEAANQALFAAYEKNDKKWIPIFHKKLEVVQVKPEVRAKLAAGASAVWEEWVKDQEAKGRPGREMLDFVKAEVAKVSK